MSVAEVKKPPTLKMINSTEEKSPAEWEALYPDLWMILEVTEEDECEVHKARLVATAEDDMELVDLARDYICRGIVYMITRGKPKEGGPYVGMNKTINVRGLSEEQVKFIQDLVEFLRAKAAKKWEKPKKAVEIEFGSGP